MEVGIKELRDNLSRHLASVHHGHTVTITDHGRPIARIVPIGHPTRLETLIAEGRVAKAPHRKTPALDPLPAAGTVSDLVRDQRR
ncbi:type II toxin-antitoxin system Phd/YefM family antitoxin [Jatrophihabitans sp.]|jgi:prevent-host-death family protein|uniref:type II toxin-antitoxin system Phd/YefM family antitoxin n=1 Tax=Jatrophihabitans sp. TaxID=1932789 RepID=UPI002F1BE243